MIAGREMLKDPDLAEERRSLGLLDDIESLIRNDFGGVVTRPLLVTLTTAILT